jgi:integrase
MAKLTDRTIVQMKLAESRREVPDGGCPGLYLVIHPSGAKAWALRFRSPVDLDEDRQRKAKKLTLGPLANDATDDEPQIGRPLSLSQARVLATGALEQVRRGIDPTHERRTEKAASRDEAISRSVNTVDAAIVEFLARYRGPKKRGLRDSTRHLTAYYLGLKPDPENPGGWVKTGGGVLKRWSGRPLVSITQHDVRALVEAIDDGGAPVSANRTLTTLKTLFKFYVKRGLLAVSPAELVDAPAAEESRDRTLTDDEIKAVWKAADVAAYPFGRLVQTLLLTGARRDELREAPWAEFDLDGAMWTLPADRTKNGREHSIPLSDTAVQILTGMPRIKGGLLFTTSGDTPFSGLSKAKRRLDEASGVQGWTLHDLRRTAATGMADKCGVAPHVIEAALNHISGDAKRGVAGIYNRAKYADEIRKALQAWADYLDGLVNGRKGRVVAGANVVALR